MSIDPSVPRVSRACPPRRETLARSGFRAGFAALSLAVACGEPAGPTWTDVVASGSGASTGRASRPLVLPAGENVRVAGEGGDAHLEIVFTAADWTRQELPGFWLAEPSLILTGGGGAQTNSSGFRLSAGARSFAPSPTWELDKGFPPDHFYVGPEGVVLRLPKGEKPAEETKLSLRMQGGGDGAGRVYGRRFSGRGFQVWPGQSLSIAVDVPADSVLRFATTLEPLLEAGAAAEPVVYRILQDGAPIFEHTFADPSEATYRWHALELARTGESRLSFEVSGSLALACFLDPVLGPKELGTPGRRPWPETRPDLLLFLADTFRADTMSAYGGEPGLTPNLNRLAEQSLLFRRAWSVGTYTLPAHVSMFTSVLPYEAGLRTIENALPEDIETIAEALSAAGYRTGAITDAGIVSRRFAFDQGFEYFDERQTGIESTVARALDFLDADDGRPTFLFVQSYRVHAPYKVSAETRAAHGERLGIAGEFLELEQRLFELARAQDVPVRNGKLPPAFLSSEAATPLVAAIEAHYLGGVVDLDRGFGAFHQALEQRRWFEHGTLVFTSDHGEAFGEHGEFQHGDKVFEAKTRIPLFLKGRGIEPRQVDEAASLLDITPTLAALAGLAPRAGWRGEPLHALRHDRPVFSFGFDGDPTFSVVEGARKVIGFQAEGQVDRERMLGGFDLTRDPHETDDHHARGEAWPLEMLARYGAEIERALVPAIDARAAELDQQDLDELDALGYGNQ